LNGIVDFYGYCTREKLPELYNEADVFILPSFAESFGLVFAEAMACGLPIIGAKTGGIVDLVESKNGILVDQGNIKQLKDAILKMKQSSELRMAMGKSNRKKVVEHYSWKNVSLRYLNIYQVAKNKNTEC
jgi:glycosyltransferase involved in cell wall biosynthesis